MGLVYRTPLGVLLWPSDKAQKSEQADKQSRERKYHKQAQGPVPSKQ
jgi:hypothetical protein